MLLNLVGAIIHFIFLISIHDIQRRSEVYTGTWKNCTNEPISKRLVLYLCEGLDANETSNSLSSDSFLFGKKNAGAWGTATGTDSMKISGLTAVASGFEKQSTLFSTIYQGELKQWDNIFNYAKSIVYIGGNSTLQSYEKKTNLWTNIILESDILTKLITEKQNTLETISQLISLNSSIKETNNVLIVVHLKNELLKSKEKTLNKNFLSRLDSVIKTITLFFDDFFIDQQSTYILSSDKVPVSKWRNRSESLFAMWGNKVKVRENIIIQITDINVIISLILGNPIPLSSVGQWCDGLFDITESTEAKAKACNAFHLASVASTVLQQVGNKILTNMGFSFSNEGDLLLVYENQLAVDVLKGNANVILSTSNKLISLSTHIINKDFILIRQIVNYLMHLTYVGWSLLLITKIIKLSVSRDIILKHEIKMIKRKTQIWFFGMNIIIVTTGGLCILFVIVQGWPFYYIMYCLPTISIWGYVLNYIEYWIAFIVKTSSKKLCLILIYSIIYAGIIESYVWGISYNLVLMGNVICVSLINIILCYIKKEYVGIKVTTISAALLLACSVFTPLNKEKINLTLLIPSGLIWPVGGLLNAIYMTLSKEIIDAVVMGLCIMHYCISFSIVIISFFYQHRVIIIIYVIQIVVGLCLPFLGNPVVPATEVPQGIDRYKKSNRLHHISICLSSLLLLVSLAFETLFSYILYVFLLMWHFITEPTIKTESINKENAHNAMTFVVLVILIQHVFGLQEPTVTIPYGNGNSFPNNELTAGILDNAKLYIIVGIAQIVFTSLSLSSGGDEQLLLATFILHLCGYRIFINMDGLNQSSQYKLQAHTSLQFIMTCLFFTLSLTKVLLRASIAQVIPFGRSVMQVVLNRPHRNN